jgi:hypothetical protein
MREESTWASRARNMTGWGLGLFPADALWGVHTSRAVENCPLSGRPVRGWLVHAYGAVKLACARTNHELGYRWDARKSFGGDRAACEEMSAASSTGTSVVDALQGGAGTSTNMNVNEVLANRALQILGRTPGELRDLSPIDDLNLHQSTNDTTRRRCASRRSVGFVRSSRRSIALVDALPGSGAGVRRRRQGRPDAAAGRGADDAGAELRRVRRGVCAGSLAGLASARSGCGS